MILSFSLFAFTIAATSTPGPNNIMMLASGLNFGIRRSIPHWLGVCTGVPAMVITLGLGLDQLFKAWPISYLILKVLGGLYMLYLAYKIAFTKVATNDKSASRPLTFIQGVLFQWINPKAWVMCIGAIAAFTIEEATLLPQVIQISLTFMCIGLICVGSWLFAGSRLKQLLANAKHQSIFNRVMALLLVASLIPMLNFSAH